MALRVLLTGFEPFAGAAVNASEQLVAAMPAGAVPGVELHTAVLPVVFDRAANQLLELTDELRPQVVLATGLAEGRSELSFERVAINFDQAPIPDNAGQLRNGNSIVANGPAAYFTGLPIDEMAAAARQAGVAAGTSLSAGSFVCNHVFYMLLHEFADTELRAGFLHVPLLATQQLEYPKLPTMPLAEMVRGLGAALTAMTRAAE